MNRNKIIYALILSASWALSSCNQQIKQDDNSTKISISHKFGTIETKTKPEKVVVFDMGTLEIFQEFNLPVAGIPKDFVATHVNSYKLNPKVKDAGSIIQPNFELVSAIKPDLIIISNVIAAEYDKLAQIAPTLYLGIDNANFKGSILQNLINIGTIYDIKDQTNLIAKQIEDKMDSAKKTISKSPKKIMLLMYNSGTLSSFGTQSRYAFVFNDLGAKPAENNSENVVHGTIVSSELISKLNPDILYIIDRTLIMEGIALNKKEVENPLIQRTNAFKTNHIHYLDPNVWYISGGGTYSINKMIDDILQGYN